MHCFINTTIAISDSVPDSMLLLILQLYALHRRSYGSVGSDPMSCVTSKVQALTLPNIFISVVQCSLCTVYIKYLIPSISSLHRLIDYWRWEEKGKEGKPK